MHIMMTAKTMKPFQSFEQSLYLSHTEAMPMEYATCSEGQTPVLVSKE